MREPRYYSSEERRYIYDNLQCTSCGNSEAFSIDLRLRHIVRNQTDGQLTVELDSRAGEVFSIIRREIYSVIDKGIDRDQPLIFCANCGDGYVDVQERLQDICWNMGCPGCEVCGNYLPVEELYQACVECIQDHNGEVTEEDCIYNCPCCEEGLSHVRVHYSITLDELKREAGYVP